MRSCCWLLAGSARPAPSGASRPESGASQSGQLPPTVPDPQSITALGVPARASSFAPAALCHSETANGPAGLFAAFLRRPSDDAPKVAVKLSPFGTPYPAFSCPVAARVAEKQNAGNPGKVQHSRRFSHGWVRGLEPPTTRSTVCDPCAENLTRLQLASPVRQWQGTVHQNAPF